MPWMLFGSPSWIRIEPCAVHRNPVFGGFWRTSGSCVLAENNPIPRSPRLKAVEFANAMRGGAGPLSTRLPGRIRLRHVCRWDIFDLWISTRDILTRKRAVNTHQTGLEVTRP